MAIDDTITIAQLPGIGSANPQAAIIPASVNGATVGMTMAQVRGVYGLPPPDANPSVNVANLTAAFEAACAGGIGGLIIAPPGVYPINDTIEIRDVWGLRYLGSSQTLFVWVGDDATKPIFKMAHCNHCVIDGLYTRALGAALGHLQMLRDNAPGWSVTPSYNRIFNSSFEGQGNTAYGVIIGGPGAVDANNEFNVFDQVSVYGYTEAGFYAPNSQAFGTLMMNCTTSGQGVGKYGLDTGGVGASIRWIGGSFDHNTAADMRLGRTSQAHIIDGPQSESSARFLDLTLDAMIQVVARGVRWTGQGIHADMKCIRTNNTALLTLDSCTIGEGNPVTPPVTMEFLQADNPAPSSIRVINTTVISSADQVFIGDTSGVHVEGSIQMVSELGRIFRVLTRDGV